MEDYINDGWWNVMDGLEDGDDFNEAGEMH